MNKHGQSLITFILILPLITLFVAFFIDSSLCIMEKNKIEGIITSNMKEALDNDIRDEEKIKKAILKNDDLEVLVSVLDDDLKINVKSHKKTVFGNMLKFPWYDLKFNYCGNYQDKKINKKCG